jgi:hypothetical protein
VSGKKTISSPGVGFCYEISPLVLISRINHLPLSHFAKYHFAQKCMGIFAAYLNAENINQYQVAIEGKSFPNKFFK